MKDMDLVDVRSVQPLDGYRVRLAFSDGFERVVDLGPYLKGPIFKLIRDPEYFSKVQVNPETGTIAWPNGADIDPLVLRYDLVPASQEDTSEPAAPSPSSSQWKRVGSRGFHFVLRKGSAGRYTFSLVASNGKIIVTSVSYSSKASALRAIESVKHVGVDASVVEQD